MQIQIFWRDIKPHNENFAENRMQRETEKVEQFLRTQTNVLLKEIKLIFDFKF